MRKSGSLWISAVIYIALGMVVLTLILTAGVPLVGKMKDKNTIAQSKRLFYTLDDNIRSVVNEGPGSKRYLSPFEIGEGEVWINDIQEETIRWEMTTKAKLFEPNYLLTEGPLELWLNETKVVDEYVMKIMLDYSSLTNISLNSVSVNPFSGSFSMTIEHTGNYNAGDNLPVIEIKID